MCICGCPWGVKRRRNLGLESQQGRSMSPEAAWVQWLEHSPGSLAVRTAPPPPPPRGAMRTERACGNMEGARQNISPKLQPQKASYQVPTRWKIWQHMGKEVCQLQISTTDFLLFNVNESC